MKKNLKSDTAKNESMKPSNSRKINNDEKCTLTDCIQGPFEHTLKVNLCEEIIDFSEQSVPFNSKMDGVNQKTASQLYYSEELLDNTLDKTLTETIEEHPESLVNIEIKDPQNNYEEERRTKIKNFYSKWSNFPNSQKILTEPTKPIIDLLQSQEFPELSDMLEQSLLCMHKISSILVPFMQNFILERDIDNFLNLSIYLKGAAAANISNQESHIRSLSEILESNTERIQNDVLLIAEHMKNISLSAEHLRVSVNDVSEVSKKLVAEKNLLELKKNTLETCLTTKGQKETTKMKVPTVMSGHYRIFLTDYHKINIERTLSCNPSIPALEQYFLNLINLYKEPYIPSILTIGIPNLILLYPYPNKQSDETAARELWTLIREKYVPLPEGQILWTLIA